MAEKEHILLIVQKIRDSPVEVGKYFIIYTVLYIQNGGCLV